MRQFVRILGIQTKFSFTVRPRLTFFFGTKNSEKPHYCEDTLKKKTHTYVQYTKLKLLKSCK